MNTRDLFKIGTSFVLYLLLQVFIIRNLVFFDVAFCFAYISVILFLPNNTPTGLLLLFSFLVGLFIDIFYNTAGIHASACLVLGFSRGYILRVLFPTKGLDAELVVSLGGMGTERFVRYILVMTFLHHSYLFFIEAGSLNFFLNTSLKIVASVLFTSFVVFLLHVYFRSLQNS
jgi:hypothetical protein